MIGYGPWIEPTLAGQASFLPGHNSRYKRAVLLEYGDQLEDMLVSETVMHLDLCRKGYRLYIESSARAAHVNFSLLSSWLPVQLYSGRVFAGSRARNWSLLRRLVLWNCLAVNSDGAPVAHPARIKPSRPTALFVGSLVADVDRGTAVRRYRSNARLSDERWQRNP